MNKEQQRIFDLSRQLQEALVVNERLRKEVKALRTVIQTITDFLENVEGKK